MPVFIARYAFSIAISFIVVFSLFWLMQYLIVSADRGLDEADAGTMLDFVRIKPEETVNRRPPKPDKPPPPDEPPPEPPPPAMDNITPEAQAMAVSVAPINVGINLSSTGFGLAPSDGEYLPIVKVQPIYPRRALSRGIEGYVIVEFTVTKQGTTRDVRVVESTSSMFNSAAVKAAQKFKYKPRVVDGQPIEVPGVQNKITFIIED